MERRMWVKGRFGGIGSSDWEIAGEWVSSGPRRDWCAGIQRRETQSEKKKPSQHLTADHKGWGFFPLHLAPLHPSGMTSKGQKLPASLWGAVTKFTFQHFIQLESFRHKFTYNCKNHKNALRIGLRKKNAFAPCVAAERLAAALKSCHSTRCSQYNLHKPKIADLCYTKWPQLTLETQQNGRHVTVDAQSGSKLYENKHRDNDVEG